MTVELYNCGRRDQRLAGYPVIRVLDARLKPIKMSVGHGASYVAKSAPWAEPSTTVRLKPGDLASARIFWPNPVERDREPVITAAGLEAAPRSGEPLERLSDVPIELGRTRRLGLGPWQQIRASNGEAKGAQPGDMAPHYADNHAWQRTVSLDSAGQLLRETTARKIRPALERLRTTGRFTAASVRTTLQRLGFAGNSDGATQTIDEVTYVVYPGRGTCVFGRLRRDRLTVETGGVLNEGGCTSS